MAGALVTVAVRITNAEACRRLNRVIRRLHDLSVEWPWIKELDELADELADVKKEFCCVATGREAAHDQHQA